MTVSKWVEQTEARITALAAVAGLTPLETAILQTVAYADVFDYPLTPAEIHRYLITVPATQPEIYAALSRLIPDQLEAHAGYYTLPGRAKLIAVRTRREASAHVLWPAAHRYAASIAALPFVRMVAVTGALAVDNPREADDIDYLIITEPGRLWLCRAFVIGIVKLAQRHGTILCPNFFLSERALAIDEQNLFSAHELAQMVPLIGEEPYTRMMQSNAWMLTYLPNTNGQARRFSVIATPRTALKSVLETLLRTRIGSLLERWEMRRKIAKLTRRLGDVQTHEVAFNVDRCQGHFDRHGEHTLSAYTRRLHELDAPDA